MRLTLCGSAKFENLFHLWNERLTLAGQTVYSLAVFPSYKNGDKNWYNEEQKIALDVAHFAKIMNSDGIVVLTDENYYGESTKREIAFARAFNKVVFWTVWRNEADNEDKLVTELI